jgi:hypothetical protein
MWYDMAKRTFSNIKICKFVSVPDPINENLVVKVSVGVPLPYLVVQPMVETKKREN